MKAIFSIYLFFAAIQLHSDEWESLWAAALENHINKDYPAAEHNFNQTISLMESNHNEVHPLIYADQARLYLDLNKYEEALNGINKALNSEELKGKERRNAICTRVICRAKLGLLEGQEQDLNYLANHFETHVENTENYVIIRNMPKNEALRESLSNFFIHSGICRDKEDIKILSSDTYLVKKDLASRFNFAKQILTVPFSVTNCRLFCDDNAISAISWCINYPDLCLVNACNQAILFIQNNCHACCQNGFSQEFCASPFGDILSVMQLILLNTPCCGCR